MLDSKTGLVVLLLACTIFSYSVAGGFILIYSLLINIDKEGYSSEGLFSLPVLQSEGLSTTC